MWRNLILGGGSGGEQEEEEPLAPEEVELGQQEEAEIQPAPPAPASPQNRSYGADSSDDGNGDQHHGILGTNQFQYVSRMANRFVHQVEVAVGVDDEEDGWNDDEEDEAAEEDGWNDEGDEVLDDLDSTSEQDGVDEPPPPPPPAAVEQEEEIVVSAEQNEPEYPLESTADDERLPDVPLQAAAAATSAGGEEEPEFPLQAEAAVVPPAEGEGTTTAAADAEKEEEDMHDAIPAVETNDSFESAVQHHHHHDDDDKAVVAPAVSSEDDDGWGEDDSPDLFDEDDDSPPPPGTPDQSPEEEVMESFHTPLPMTGGTTTTTTTPAAPDSAVRRLEASEREAAGQLDSVLQQIEQQEPSLISSAVATPPRPDGPSHDNEPPPPEAFHTPPRPAATTTETAPDSVGLRMEKSGREAEGQLDTVLQQIEQQELQATTPRPNDISKVDSASSDDEHQEMAVVQIQQEIEEVTQAVAMTPMVDHTPRDKKLHYGEGTGGGADDENDEDQEEQDPSLVVQAELEDLTRDTGGVGNGDNLNNNDEDVYDDENEQNYGPVVDHTPHVAPPSPMNRQDSLAVQGAEYLRNDFNEDAAMSASDSGWRDDDIDVDDNSDNEGDQKEETLAPEAHVVDHTPAEVNSGSHRKESHGSASVGVLASMGETAFDDAIPGDDKEVGAHELFGPVVDVTPTTPAPPDTNNSLAVHASEIEQDFENDEAMEYTCYGDSTVGRSVAENGEDEEDDGGWDDENEAALVDLVEQSRSKVAFSPILTEPGDPLVDHTPSEMPDDAQMASRDPSIVALAMSEDRTRDTGMGLDEEVYDDENEQEYGPVVDHTPQAPLPSMMASGTNSLAVDASAVKQDIEEDEAMDDTSYNNSSIADDETDTAGVGGNAGWVQDDPDIEDDTELLGIGQNELALVDHTPSEMESPTKHMNGDPSVEVLASVANTRDTGDQDSTGEGKHVVYGPVVDITPPAPTATGPLARSDSVVVQGQEDADTVDESTADGDIDENADDTEAGEMPSQLRTTSGDEDQLVDFIPARSESRYGDGSTQVAADPSEVLSEVDDFAPEEQDFGPVVDVTPPTRQPVVAAEQPSGEGSTVVFAPPSVAVDDLDPEDEADADADAVQDGWENDPIVEETPNPQSGNDEPANRVNEQLVDFLPAPDEASADLGDTTAREGLSEMTVGGGLSLLPAGDQPEDEFGPVVDQIPSVAQEFVNSDASSAAQLTASECIAMEKDDKVNGRLDDASTEQGKEKIVVDHLPQLDTKRPMDSTATLGRSLLSEEEEEEDASKFGPVVDHLPTSRASLAPSRGGSTVDALATVSEVDSDDEEGGGWDDEADYDASVGGASESVARQGTALRQTLRASSGPSSDADRNVSVRFDSSVDKSHATERGFAAAERSTSAPDATPYYDPDSSESQYYDPEPGTAANGWGDALSLDGTPNHFHEATDDTKYQSRQARMTAKSFAEADTPPSTPYRRPELSRNHVEDKEKSIDVALPLLGRSAAVEAVSCTRCADAKTIECPCVQRLLDANSENGDVVATMVTQDGDTVRIDIGQLLQDEVARRRILEQELEALKASTGSQELQESLERARESEMEDEILELKEAKAALSKALTETESESVNLRDQNATLSQQLSKYQKSVSDLEKERSALVAKGSSSQAEIQALKKAVEDSLTNGDTEEDTGGRLAALQTELASKTGECKKLETKVAQMEERLIQAEREHNDQARESAELSKLLKETINSLKEQLTGSDELVKSTEKARHELERKLKALDSEVSNLRSSSKKVATLQIQHENDLQEQYKLLDKKTANIHAMEEMITSIQKEKAIMMAELSQQRNLAQQSESLANELIAVAKERDLLEEALCESKEAMVTLQDLIEKASEERQALDSKREEEKAGLRADLEEIRSALDLKERETADLSGTVEAATKENRELQSSLEELRESLRMSETKYTEAQVAFEAEKTKTTDREQEVESLKEELNLLSRNHEELQSEVELMTENLSELGKCLRTAEEEAAAYSATNSELETEIAKLRETAESATEERDAVASDRDKSKARCDEMEASYSAALTEFEESTRKLTKEYEDDIAQLRSGSDELREEIRRLQEAEMQHAQALEGVEKNMQEEARQYEENSAQLRKECESLREELAVARETEEVRSRKLKTLEEEAQTRATDAEFAAEVEALQIEVAKYRQMQAEESAALVVAEKKLEAQSQEHEEKSTNLLKECDQLRAELSQYASDHSAQAAALDAIEQDLADARSTHEEQISQLRGERDDYRTQVERHQEIAEELASERDRLGEVMRECDMLGEENEEMLVQFGLLKQQMDETEGHARELEEEIRVLKAAPPKNEEELETLEAKNAELESEIQALASERDSLKENLEQSNQGFEAEKKKREALDSTVAELKLHADDLEKQCENHKVEIETLKEDLHAADVPGLKKQLGILSADCLEKDETLARHKEEIQSLKEKIESAYESSDAKSRKIDNFRKKIKEQEEAHTRQIENLEEQSRKLEHDLHVSNEQIKTAEAALEAKKHVTSLYKDAELQIQEIESQMEEKNGEISSLKRSVDDLQAQVDNSKERDKGLAAELPALQKQIDVLNEALQSTRSRLASREAVIDGLSAEVRSMQSKKSEEILAAVSAVSQEVTEKTKEAIARGQSAVSMASKLNRSEKSRADAIARVEAERKANAETLRRLRESVEKYYT